MPTSVFKVPGTIPASPFKTRITGTRRSKGSRALVRTPTVIDESPWEDDVNDEKSPQIYQSLRKET